MAGWMREWADRVTGAPTLNEVMTGAAEPSALSKLIGSVKEVLPEAVSAAKGALATLSYSGSLGNFTSSEQDIVLSGRFIPIVEQAPEKIGRPLYQHRYIGTLSGFVKCEDAVFSGATATREEEEAVEALMKKGFFYE